MNTLQQSVPGNRQVLVTAKGRGNGRPHPDASAAIVRMAESQAEHRAVHRHAMIAEAAYFRAEKRGFAPGHEVEDWVSAELEVEAAERLSTLCPSDAITAAEKACWAAQRA